MGASRGQDTLPRPEPLHSVLSYKRLERGTFRIPALLRPGDTTVVLDAQEFARILEGLDLPRSKLAVGVKMVRKDGPSATP